MHTQHAGIESTWEIYLTESKYVKVFIWHDKEDMWKAVEEINPQDEKDYYGLCSTIPMAIHKKTKTRLCGRKFAELHLLRDQIGSGYIAHEIYHLINYWSHFLLLTPQLVDNDDESLALLTGVVTSQFWREWFKRYE